MQETNRTLHAQICDATSQALGIVSAQQIKASRRARKAQRSAAQQGNIVTGMPVAMQHAQVFHTNQAQIPYSPLPQLTMQMRAHPVYPPFYTAYDGTTPCLSLPAIPMSVQMGTTATGWQTSASFMLPPPSPQQEQQQQQQQLLVLQQQQEQEQQHDVVIQQQQQQQQQQVSTSDSSSDMSGAHALLEIGMAQNTATQQQVENMQNVVHEAFERHVLDSHGMSAPSTDEMMHVENVENGEDDGELPEHEATECMSTDRMQSESTHDTRKRETLDAFNQRVDRMFGHVNKTPWKPPCVLVLGAFTMTHEETEAEKKYFNNPNNRMGLANDISDATNTGAVKDHTRFVSKKVAFDKSHIKDRTMHFVNKIVQLVDGELLHGAALWSLGNEESVSDYVGNTCRGKRQFYHFDWDVNDLESEGLSAYTLVFTMDDDAVLGFARFTHTEDGSGIPNQSSRFVLKFKQWSAILFRHDLWHCGEIYKKFHMRIHYYIGPKGYHLMRFRSTKKEQAKEDDLQLFAKEDTSHYQNTAQAGLSGLRDVMVTDVSSHPLLTPVSLADSAWEERVKDMENRAVYPVCKGDMPTQDKKKPKQARKGKKKK